MRALCCTAMSDLRRGSVKRAKYFSKLFPPSNGFAARFLPGWRRNTAFVRTQPAQISRKPAVNRMPGTSPHSVETQIGPGKLAADANPGRRAGCQSTLVHADSR